MSDPNRLERLARRVLVHDPIDEGDAEIDVLGRAGGDHVRLPTVRQELLHRGKPFSISSLGSYSTATVFPLTLRRPLVFDKSW